MNKELYNKLDFKERCAYRIENNSTEFPKFDWGMFSAVILVTILLANLGNFASALFILQVGNIGFATIYFIYLVDYAIQKSKQEKEWINYILKKVQK